MELYEHFISEKNEIIRYYYTLCMFFCGRALACFPIKRIASTHTYICWSRCIRNVLKTMNGIAQPSENRYIALARRLRSPARGGGGGTTEEGKRETCKAIDSVSRSIFY